jgi:hypothetical protein
VRDFNWCNGKTIIWLSYGVLRNQSGKQIKQRRIRFLDVNNGKRRESLVTNYTEEASVCDPVAPCRFRILLYFDGLFEAINAHRWRYLSNVSISYAC